MQVFSLEPPSRVRMIREPLTIVGLPLHVAGPTSAFDGESCGSVRTHHFEAIGWEIASAGSPPSSLSSRVLLDFWLKLLAAWDSVSDTIVLERSDSLRGGRSHAGSHYRQRLAALEYLRDVRLGAERLPVISGWNTASDGGAIEVRLHPEFRARYLGGPAVILDPRIVEQLEPGTPRALYRALAWMQAEGAHAITARELFERMGSMRTDTRPFRVHRALDGAHEQLVRAGALAQMPKVTGRKRGTEILYTIASPQADLTAVDVLRTGGQAFGVNRHRLDSLLDEQPEDLARALAATALGLIEVDQALPKAIWTYASQSLPIVDKGDRRDTHGASMEDLQHSHERYLLWASRECRTRATSESDMYRWLRQFRAGWRQELATRDGYFPDWVAEGLALVTLQRLLHVPSLVDYRRRRLDSAPPTGAAADPA